jgi:zinc protease
VPRRGLAGALVFLLALFAAHAAGAALFAAKTFTLANGLQVVVIENHRSPVVAQMLFYRVGGADAPIGKSGIAHFLEHLMFKGTPAVPDGEFSRKIVRLGGMENAFTTQDYTAYYQMIARQHLPVIMQMEADRMVNLVLREDEVLSERDVIIEERRQRVDDDPSGRLSEMVQAALFLNHPYRLPVLGWEHEMHLLNRTDALTFYKRWYAPNNAILVIAGDTTLAEVKTLAEKYFAPIPARTLAPHERLREPPSFAARQVTLKDPDVQQATWQRIYITPPDHENVQKATALDLLGEILAGGPTSRLYRHLVVDQGLAVAVDAGESGDQLDYGQFTISAAPPAGGDTVKLEAAIDGEIATLLDKGVSEAELAAAKNRIAADAIKARDSLRGPAQLVGTALITGTSLEQVESYPERIAAVSAAEVLQAAKDILQHKENSVTGILLPGEGAPGEPGSLPHQQMPAGAIQ